MRRRQVMLRAFARCASAQDMPGLGQALLAALSHALPALQARPRGAPERYWKVPELVEFDFVAPGPESLPSLVALCSKGWSAYGDDDDPSWVWNAEPGACFLHPSMVWAEVLLVDS